VDPSEHASWPPMSRPVKGVLVRAHGGDSLCAKFTPIGYGWVLKALGFWRNAVSGGGCSDVIPTPIAKEL